MADSLLSEKNAEKKLRKEAFRKRCESCPRDAYILIFAYAHVFYGIACLKTSAKNTEKDLRWCHIFKKVGGLGLQLSKKNVVGCAFSYT